MRSNTSAGAVDTSEHINDAEQPLFNAAVQGMLEGLRDNPSAHSAASISGIASAALSVIQARHMKAGRALKR